MKKKRLYLDTSVFMAEFNKKDIRHETLNNFFKEVLNLKDTELCTSKWALTELNNRLTKDQIKELKIVKYINEILDKNKIRTIKLTILNVHPKEHYTFHDFFSDLSKDLKRYKTGKERPGLGDIIHVRIMKNNKIKTIVTFDSDFESITGFDCLNLMKGIRKENETTNTNK